MLTRNLTFDLFLGIKNAFRPIDTGVSSYQLNSTTKGTQRIISPLMMILRTSVVPAPISSSLMARYRRLISDSQM